MPPICIRRNAAKKHNIDNIVGNNLYNVGSTKSNLAVKLK